ncbi:MAG: hypothetical protein JRJ56_07995 [Deltaproteobacteria bacterium]|nr:hypothetical protein [Deltaproteobacteria bacterium]
MRKLSLLIFVALSVAATGVYAYNYSRLQRVMDEIVAGDCRAAGLEIAVHYENYLNPDVLVFDLQALPQTLTMADVFRVFLQFAEKKQFEEFSRVKLAFQGKTKFHVDGDYFRELGREYPWQDISFTMYSFPAHLRKTDSSPAYGESRTGLSWVAREQLQDFSDFCRRWCGEGLTE